MTRAIAWLAVCLVGVLMPRHGAAQDTAGTAILSQADEKRLLAGLSQYDRAAPLTGRLVSRGTGPATILVTRWLDDFAPLHPDAVFNVEAPGTERGLAALRTDSADIVPTGRPLTPAEVDSLTHVFGHPPLQLVVALDALGLYVNEKNPIDSLTFDQLDAIFSHAPRGGREAERWADVGVAGDFGSVPIRRFSLDSLNTVNGLIRQRVLQGQDYRFDVKFESVPRGMVQDVGAFDGGVAFASIIFATLRTRLVPLVGPDGVAHSPTPDEVAAGRYPLSRPFYIVLNKTPGKPLPPLVREFLRFAVSRRGQQIVTFGGEYPITPDQQRQDLAQLE